jgi:hypothetical protein
VGLVQRCFFFTSRFKVSVALPMALWFFSPWGLKMICLVTDDGVFPMYFEDDGTDANVFSLSSGTDIRLGHV